MFKVDLVIIGAGFAGAATAYHLSERFTGSVLLLEREVQTGRHASGKNAGMVLQPAADPEVGTLLAVSCRVYHRLKERIGFHPTGSILIGDRRQIEGLCDRQTAISELWDAERVRARVPLLENHAFECGLWTPSDGVMEVPRLLDYYLQGAQEHGVRLLTGCSVQTIRKPGPFHLVTSSGEIESRWIINAAGAWATSVAELAGASEQPLIAYRRHLFLLSELGDFSSSAPFVWNLRKEFYFRPMGHDLLFSICDEEPAAELTDQVDPEIRKSLQELIWAELPELTPAVITRDWACLRTRTQDHRPVIGWDSRLQDFFWVAGLAGHGMASSWELGHTAAQAFLGEETSSFSPSRFGSIVSSQGQG